MYTFKYLGCNVLKVSISKSFQQSVGLLIGFRVVILCHPFVFDVIKNLIMRVGLWEIPTLVWVHRFVILDSMNVIIRHVHAEMKGYCYMKQFFKD